MSSGFFQLFLPPILSNLTPYFCRPRAGGDPVFVAMDPRLRGDDKMEIIYPLQKS